MPPHHAQPTSNPLFAASRQSLAPSSLSFLALFDFQSVHLFFSIHARPLDLHLTLHNQSTHQLLHLCFPLYKFPLKPLDKRQTIRTHVCTTRSIFVTVSTVSLVASTSTECELHKDSFHYLISIHFPHICHPSIFSPSLAKLSINSIILKSPNSLIILSTSLLVSSSAIFALTSSLNFRDSDITALLGWRVRIYQMRLKKETRFQSILEINSMILFHIASH